MVVGCAKDVQHQVVLGRSALVGQLIGKTIVTVFLGIVLDTGSIANTSCSN